MKSNLPAMQPSTEVEYSSHSNISTHCGLASTAQPWFDRGGFTLIIADTHSRQQTLKNCGLIIGLGGWLLPHTAFGWTGHPDLRARFLLSPSCLHSGAVEPTLLLSFLSGSVRGCKYVASPTNRGLTSTLDIPDHLLDFAAAM